MTSLLRGAHPIDRILHDDRVGVEIPTHAVGQVPERISDGEVVGGSAPVGRARAAARENQQEEGRASHGVGYTRPTSRVLLALPLLLGGCVHGDPFDPADVCPDVTISMEFEPAADSALTTDSIRHGDCAEETT